jgi:hypothetical protein
MAKTKSGGQAGSCSGLSFRRRAFAPPRRLKTLGGLTPYECICKVWTSEPDHHQMPGLNT